MVVAVGVEHGYYREVCAGRVGPRDVCVGVTCPACGVVWGGCAGLGSSCQHGWPRVWRDGVVAPRRVKRALLGVAWVAQAEGHWPVAAAGGRGRGAVVWCLTGFAVAGGGVRGLRNLFLLPQSCCCCSVVVVVVVDDDDDLSLFFRFFPPICVC